MRLDYFFLPSVLAISIPHLGHSPGLSEVEPSIGQTYFVTTISSRSRSPTCNPAPRHSWRDAPTPAGTRWEARQWRRRMLGGEESNSFPSSRLRKERRRWVRFTLGAIRASSRPARRPACPRIPRC